MRRTIELVAVQGNSSVGKKTIIAPVGLDYIDLDLVGETAVASDVSNLKEKLNTEVIRDIAGADQENMNLLDQLASMSVDNILRIPFEMLRMKTVESSYGTTRNTLSTDPETGNAINNMQIEWTEGVGDTWRVFAEVDDAILGGPGGISRFQTLSVNLAANANATAGIASYLLFGSPERRFFWRGLFSLAAGTFNNGDTLVVRGNAKNEIFRRNCALNARLLTDAGARAIPAGYSTANGGLIIDTTETGMAEMFDTMRPASPAEAAAGVKPQGYAEMGGQGLLPETMFDMRFSPTQSTTIDGLIVSVGRL